MSVVWFCLPSFFVRLLFPKDFLSIRALYFTTKVSSRSILKCLVKMVPLSLFIAAIRTSEFVGKIRSWSGAKPSLKIGTKKRHLTKFQLIQLIQTVFISIFSIRCLIELKFCEVSQNSFPNRCWMFQFSILKNKKVLFLKKYDLSCSL